MVSVARLPMDRNYVNREQGKLIPSELGFSVNDFLVERLPALFDIGFTAQMENSLDQVANHEAEWKAVLDHFFSDFTQQLDKAEKDPEEGGMRPNQMVLTSIDCPTCGRKMGIRTASTGVFLGCSGYALPPKERCKTTINLVPENEVLNDSKISVSVQEDRGSIISSLSARKTSLPEMRHGDGQLSHRSET